MRRLKELLRRIYARRILDEILSLDRDIEIEMKEIESVAENYIKFRKKVITGKPYEIDRELLLRYACYLTLNPSERKKVLGK